MRKRMRCAEGVVLFAVALLFTTRATRSAGRVFLRGGWGEAVLRRVWLSTLGGGIGT